MGQLSDECLGTFNHMGAQVRVATERLSRATSSWSPWAPMARPDEDFNDTPCGT